MSQCELINNEGYALFLVARLYRAYTKPSVLNYPGSKLPVDIKYTKPQDAEECLFNAQCRVNHVLREYFEPVFERIYREKCGNLNNFKSFLEGARFHELIEQHPVDHSTPMKLLACFALATELVLYCFRNKCYILANDLPEYLHDVLQWDIFDDIFSALTDEDLSNLKAAIKLNVAAVDAGLMAKTKNLPSDAYKRFQEYCLLLNSEEPHESIATFHAIGATFKGQQLALLGPELATRVQDGESCTVCGEGECQRHLKVFIDRCVQKYGRCYNCMTVCCVCS